MDEEMKAASLQQDGQHAFGGFTHGERATAVVTATSASGNTYLFRQGETEVVGAR